MWSPHQMSDITRIESVQRVFTKRLLEYEGPTYTERLTKASLRTLELLRLRSDLVLCYKILNGLIKISSVNSFFEIDTGSKTRGHPYKLKLSHARLDSRLYFYSLNVHCLE